MKFLVLALCVCAASAASFGSSATSYGGAKPWAQASATATNYGGRIAKPTYQAVNTAPVVAEVPIVAAKAVYNAGNNVYTQAKSTYNTNSGAQAYNNVKSYNTGSEGDAAIIRSQSEVQPDGFNYVYETANGITAEASGSLKKIGDAESVVVHGSYRYTAPDGTPVVINYIADENGYQPQGDVIPVGPAIPEAIARSLQYIAAHPQQQDQYAKKY